MSQLVAIVYKSLESSCSKYSECEESLYYPQSCNHSLFQVTNGSLFFISWEVADSGAGIQPFSESANHCAATLHYVQPGKLFVFFFKIDDTW